MGNLLLSKGFELEYEEWNHMNGDVEIQQSLGHDVPPPEEIFSA